ncbi:MAG: glycoside hydrolase family 9 protein [Melioribacteraceae bacterium]|nr:glycoside hydrolase family 9 protein [Melioribacteraceae bacterium]
MTNLFRQIQIITILIFITAQFVFAQLKLNEKEYFSTQGLDVMAFSDFYPDGHQGGLTLIQHGIRTAANGDLRLEPTPGQWSAIPKVIERIVNKETNEIITKLSYPDEKKNRIGFNPIYYPDLQFDYTIIISTEGNKVKVKVSLDKPLPKKWIGKVGFNFELFPGEYYGCSYFIDNKIGKFPRQVTSSLSQENKIISMGEGSKVILAPEYPEKKIIIESASGKIQLFDGRVFHNNGWFVLRSVIPEGKTTKAIEWTITPSIIKDWKYKPVVQISQAGYTTKQKKVAVIETDITDNSPETITMLKYNTDGTVKVVDKVKPEVWGQFLRYNYFKYDFSKITEAGIYKIKYGKIETNSFEISDNVFKTNVWQPTIEYFLPVQMCHMRVNDRYRVWHGLCHEDDALMAPVNLNHFDGYSQGSSTLTKYKPNEKVPNLNVGGWHDAGDYDLRVESQAGTVERLVWIYEEFGVELDNTLIDQQNKFVEIHKPDGVSDILQQIEHGVLSIVNGYKELGRLYRGIICPSLRQYVLLGDGSTMTDNISKSGIIEYDERTENTGLKYDDRLVFTEENPWRELQTAGVLAAAGRVLTEYNPELAEDCILIAKSIWKANEKSDVRLKSVAAIDLFITTGDKKYIDFIDENLSELVKKPDRSLWILSRVFGSLNKKSQKTIIGLVKNYREKLNEIEKNNPFGVEYKPNVWGAGWAIQSFGVQQYFLHKTFPDLIPEYYMQNALSFVLGCHPGSNNASFVSGVGAKSLLTAYGVNRGDWSHIPGGVASGTALIRPDLPELKTWPYFWQQGEYMISHAALDFVILVLAMQ